MRRHAREVDPVLNSKAHLQGLTRDELRNRQWCHPAEGVSLPRAAGDDLPSTCRAIQLVLADDAVFTHWTAAVLRGWWLPDIGETPVIASTTGEAPHHDRRGVYIRRCNVPPQHRQVTEDISIASPERVIVELGETLALIDLVAVIDSALHLKDTTIERLRAAVVPGRRGVRTLRSALDLCDDGSESRWESILRLVHVLSGIPVETQADIFDRRGRFVARSDLRIAGTRRLSEYDGAGHRLLDQHRDDLRREKAVARLGLEPYGYTSIEIHECPHRIIADAEGALGWRHDPSRLKPWYDAYERSSLSKRGQIALLRRLDRFARPTPPRSRKR